MPFKILIVDDEPANLRLLERLFRLKYQVLAAPSGEEALRLLEQHDVALLITDQRMPGMTGIELLKRTADTRPHMVRMILTGYTDVGALVEAINCGQVYRYVTKPWDNDDLRLTVERALQHYETNKARHELEGANKRLSSRLQAMTRGVVRTIADTMEAKDHYTYGHARRVSGYAVAIGRRLRLSVPVLEQLSLASLLHDVGKLGTPEAILLKPTALTDEELAAVRLHAERGARLLAGVPEMEEVAAAVRHHHEDYDGSGYPEGLAGEQIPLASRIIRVTDAYDAMTSPRPFRSALGHEEAVGVLTERSGTRFDPEIVSAFCELKALATIRYSIAQGDFGSRFLPVMPAADPRRLSWAELVRVVESEPALAAAVLRAAFAAPSANKPTASLPAACARIGEDALRRLTVQTTLSVGLNYGAEVLREHSRRCAAATKLLAEKTQIMDADEAYTVGLLHDIGEALLHSLFPQEMEQIVWLDGTGPRIEREIAAFGVDHAQVGQWVLEGCGLSRGMTLAIQTHHDAIRVNDPAALLLYVADAIAHARDSSELANLNALGTECLAPLRLSRADLARIQEMTTEQVGETFDYAPA
jgi:cyclic di-GMP phosphodiesterase